MGMGLYLIQLIKMIKLIRKSLSNNLSTNNKKQILKPIVDYNQRGQYRAPLGLKIGDQINQFEVINKCHLPDFQIESVTMKCRKFGTQWVHLDCQQQKNSLGLVMKWKQTPHIMKLSLQKLLQCGSTKYPVRNPIEFMCRRSFNPQNFTYSTSDYLFHGYQTSLLHDHRNLMEVFLHILFNPLLRQQDFKEIVWRYGIGQDSKLQFKGDVYSELKKMKFLSQFRMFDAIERHIMNRTGISNPQQIVNFSYGQLVQEYQKIFRPQNLLIISHGDFHPAKLIENYRKITTQLKWQQKFQNKERKGTISPLQSQGNKMAYQKKNQNVQNNNYESKTIKIEHLEKNVPLMLSFRIQNISSTDRILLSILSYILFDMPSAVFIAWNSPQTPYPKHYGFQGNYFNIGITMLQQKQPIKQIVFLQLQKIIRQNLESLYKNKIPDQLIQQCLYHLQGQYYSTDGIKIMSGLIDNLMQSHSSALEESMNVKSFISRILRTYRKQNIFEELLKKYIIDNQKYIRICGKMNSQLIQNYDFQQSVRLKSVLQKKSQAEIEQIKQYRTPDILQNYRILPKININELQIFEQKNPTTFKVSQVPVFHVHKCDGIKISLRYDITDIDQQEMKLLPIICESFPFMGANGVSSEAFYEHTSIFIKKIHMNYETCRTTQGMKIYMYLHIEFSDRNAQYGFNLLNNLINDHNDNNLSAISQRINNKANQNYNDLTQNLVEIHGRHIGGTRSPYAMFQDPLFKARSVCGIASDILKISNPKKMLEQLAFEMQKVTKKLNQKNRLSILFECKKSNIEKYKKYLQIMLSPLKGRNDKLQVINDKDFTASSCLKYFPNYSEQFVFEAFSVPYYKNMEQMPAILVLSTIINQNISRINQSGGCFLFKGSLVSYIRGNRKKVLELQDHYKKIQDINEAKRFIFQKFKRYTAAQLFYTGTTAEQARIFKQAVALVEQANVQSCLQKYILSTIKQEKSSILALGNHLANYEPLIKKGWAVERSIEDMSVRMQSDNTAVPQIQMTKYINIY